MYATQPKPLPHTRVAEDKVQKEKAIDPLESQAGERIESRRFDARMNGFVENLEQLRGRVRFQTLALAFPIDAHTAFAARDKAQRTRLPRVSSTVPETAAADRSRGRVR